MQIRVSGFNLKSIFFSVSLSSYENANDDKPDCSGGPKFLKNKTPVSEVFNVTYTYSVTFVVSTTVSYSYAVHV